jgi:hypothetical protein
MINGATRDLWATSAPLVHYYSHMPRGEKNQKLMPTQIDEIVRRYTTKLPDGTWEGTSTLAREFGVRPGTVNRWLRVRGVEIRTAKDAHSGGKRCKPVKNLPAGGAPPCACGCGTATAWNRRRNQWNRYVTGHYRKAAPYKDEAWLREVYLTEHKAIETIAAECGVSHTAIRHFLARFEVPTRRGRPWGYWGSAPALEPLRPQQRRRLRSRIEQDDAAAIYKLRDWLYTEYAVNRRSSSEMGAECGVTRTVIIYYLKRFGIPRRDSGVGKPGELNRAWKGGVSQWPYSPDWKSLARKIRDRDKWTCQDCGECRQKWGIHLHVHHIDGNKLNNDPGNLISLCAKCHRKRHAAGNLGEVETHAA